MVPYISSAYEVGDIPEDWASRNTEIMITMFVSRVTTGLRKRKIRRP